MKKTAFILCVFSALMLTTCKKMPELKVYDLKLTSENVAYSQTSAEIKVEYDYPTDLQYVNVTMSESNYFGYSIVAQSEVIDSVFIANFVDLHTDKKYYYKFEYSNGVNVVTSDVRSFYLDAANVTLPTVITMEVHEVQGNTAVGGGEITDDGGYYVTARGVCWATHRNPTIFDRCTTDGMGTGNYTSTMTDLEPNSIYYVRAYAINEKGTSYGTEYSFETSGSGGGGGGGGGTVPSGAINGSFSVSATQQVYFSQGNLQYQASTNSWRFAELQWDYIGNDNTNISPSYNGWIDLFGWGTGNNPTNYSGNDNDYATFNDWGNNAINNGGNTPNQWRTLTDNEWGYVIDTRNTTSGIRYAKAIVNGVNGVVLLPDNWSSSTYNLSSTNSSEASFSSNIISQSIWSTKLEANGVVFLPAAGNRAAKFMHDVGSVGDYMSTNYDSSYAVNFDNESLYTKVWVERWRGLSVRLVRNVE